MAPETKMRWRAALANCVVWAAIAILAVLGLAVGIPLVLAIIALSLAIVLSPALLIGGGVWLMYGLGPALVACGVTILVMVMVSKDVAGRAGG